MRSSGSIFYSWSDLLHRGLSETVGAGLLAPLAPEKREPAIATVAVSAEQSKESHAFRFSARKDEPNTTLS